MFLIFVLAGCTAGGNVLSGDSANLDPALVHSSQLDRIHIGVTNKEEVRVLLGDPTDLQLSSRNGGATESWGYAKADPPIYPWQYFPVIGVVAFSSDHTRHSFSISFSHEGIVEGVMLEAVQPYGDKKLFSTTHEPGTPVRSYGRYNPLVRYSEHEAVSPSRFLSE